jgi:phage terminase small subunit
MRKMVQWGLIRPMSMEKFSGSGHAPNMLDTSAIEWKRMVKKLYTLPLPMTLCQNGLINVYVPNWEVRLNLTYY